MGIKIAMHKIAGVVALLACVCLIHTGEALPLQMSDTVSLVEAAEKPQETEAQQEANDLNAVEAAEKEVEATKMGRTSHPTELQKPTPMHGDDKTDEQVDRMVHEVTNDGGKIDHHDEDTMDSDAITLHAQMRQSRDKPNAEGILKPGQKGFLLQQVQGPVKSFDKTMSDINHKLQRKWSDERQNAYQHAEAARLARQASNAVGRMAEEVSTEAEENAQKKAAAVAECQMKLEQATDEADKMMIAKECNQALQAKNKAYEEASEAMSASNKAIVSAGQNAGKIVGAARVEEDGVSDLIAAENAAQAAKLRLQTHDREAKKDEEIMKNRLKLEANTHALMQKAKEQEEAAQDAYDLRVATAEQAPPPRPAVPRQPAPEQLDDADKKAMNSALGIPTTSELRAEKAKLAQDVRDAKAGVN